MPYDSAVWTPTTKTPIKKARDLENMETPRPARRPVHPVNTRVLFVQDISANEPKMLPELNCRIALAFKPPLRFTTGAEASFWYCEKDQSFGETEDGEESRRRRFRWWYCWARVGSSRQVEAPTVVARRGRRRAPGLKKRREAIGVG